MGSLSLVADLSANKLLIESALLCLCGYEFLFFIIAVCCAIIADLRGDLAPFLKDHDCTHSVLNCFVVWSPAVNVLLFLTLHTISLTSLLCKANSLLIFMDARREQMPRVKRNGSHSNTNHVVFCFPFVFFFSFCY